MAIEWGRSCSITLLNSSSFPARWCRGTAGCRGTAEAPGHDKDAGASLRVRLKSGPVTLRAIDCRHCHASPQRLKPVTMRVTISLTFVARYSAGGVQPRDCFSTVSTHDTIAPGSAPLKMLLPHSIVSGRSVTSRKVTLGTLKIEHSS
jgi:hypothetical protein